MAKITLLERVESSLVHIRKFIEEDGCELEVLGITDENIVRVELKGACKGCSMNNMTFKAGVEDAIIKAIPEIKGVEAVNFQKATF